MNSTWDDSDVFYDPSDGEDMDYELQIALQESLHQSQSQSQSQSRDVTMVDEVDGDAPPPPYSHSVPVVVSGGKGRKKFIEDFGKLKRQWDKGFTMESMKVIALKRPQDEETIELVILMPNSQRLELDLFISDTSDYPRDHSFFWCSKSEVPYGIDIGKIFEDISGFTGLSIQAIIQTLLGCISPLLPKKAEVETSQSAEDTSDDSESDLEDEDSDGTGNYDPSDNEGGDIDGFSEGGDDTGITQTMEGGRTKYTHLQAHFNELVASNFRPGYVPRSSEATNLSNDFGITISCPVTQLLEIIPARALMAWDPSILSRNQHLTLCISGFRGVYPPLDSTGSAYSTTARILGSRLQFKVGLVGETTGYKIGVDEFWQAFGHSRVQSTIPTSMEVKMADEEEEEEEEEEEKFNQDDEEGSKPIEEVGKLLTFSLSTSLESHLNQALVRLVTLRKRFNTSWGGAEVLLSVIEKTQQAPDDVFPRVQTEIRIADLEESELRRTGRIPEDIFTHLSSADLNSFNFPLVAFSYLLRRLALCTRYCVVCHNRLPPSELMHEALKPYVCGDSLCTYQYYHLNLGLPLEYEIINNTSTVDLLVSLAHLSAVSGVLDDPLPIGMAIRVPLPSQNMIVSVDAYRKPHSQLVLFDSLPKQEMRQAISQLIELIPPIQTIKEHLEQQIKEGLSKPRLKNVDPDVPEAAWLILRWCVASCTAYLEEITSQEDTIPEFDPSQSWRQFRFSVGSPAMEATFKKAIVAAQKRSAQARVYPSLYAFHGSPLHNWHSIIRNGLWYKTIAHGRAYGNGVYFASDGQVSMSHYAQMGSVTWKNSVVKPQKCMALAELVNLPNEFQESRACYVVQHTEWIVCRYLLIQSSAVPSSISQTSNSNIVRASPVRFDPAYPTLYNGKHITIPDPSHKLSTLVNARRNEYTEPEYDNHDLLVFNYTPLLPPIAAPSNDKETNTKATVPALSLPTPGPDVNRSGDWVHNPDWLNKHIANLIPPSFEATPSATRAVQMELATMLREQDVAEAAGSRLDQLGWYIPRDLVEDNLFRWIVEMHSFDSDLPLAKDMKYRNVNSLVFEIRFPPNFPNDPPFFRLLGPRLMAFAQGGGGHVTAGGSLCMDLLTSSNWLPVYRVPAVLLQVKLALSSLDPKPARLASNWAQPYTIQEAREGYLRSARTHGWQVPKGLANFVG
ncbi:hypothetical protein BDN72DRAFT_838836 [Pluteus cervinus]|uniref:Uncharacterized protein n=1 Tax=Pluteus cervinus TaxID=181527 RepID=A0ACD3AY83_9AGAR|nr:hypothetical protein BDN72DRAFT_838836 [Pluteus cervinus]